METITNTLSKRIEDHIIGTAKLFNLKTDYISSSCDSKTFIIKVYDEKTPRERFFFKIILDSDKIKSIEEKDGTKHSEFRNALKSTIRKETANYSKVIKRIERTRNILKNIRYIISVILYMGVLLIILLPPYKLTDIALCLFAGLLLYDIFITYHNMTISIFVWFKNLFKRKVIYTDIETGGFDYQNLDEIGDPITPQFYNTSVFYRKDLIRSSSKKHLAKIGLFDLYMEDRRIITKSDFVIFIDDETRASKILKNKFGVHEFKWFETAIINIKTNVMESQAQGMKIGDEYFDNIIKHYKM